MVSQHHAVRPWALPAIVTPIPDAIWREIKFFLAGTLWAKRDGEYVLCVFSDFTSQL